MAKILSGYTLDFVLLVLAAIFALQHPSLKGVKPDAFVSGTAAYWRNATAAMQDAPQRAVLLQGWYDFVLGSDLGSPAKNADPDLRAFFELNEWKNSLILPASVRDAVPHSFAIWLRNYVAIHVVYFGFGALWALYIYWLRVDYFYPRGADGQRAAMPTWESIRMQIAVSVKAMPLYVMMPTMTEWLVEKGFTRAYHWPSQIGGLDAYILWTAAYIFFVEWGIYWVHRYLHDNRFLYKILHRDHHIYNNKGDLSPFAGLAFHPVDGCLQASPYVLGLFLMPVHFWTCEVLLFFTGVWTTNIHDTLQGDTEPVMGSKYHTYHHTAYRDNYGQFFVFFDWVHDTLTEPPAKTYGKVDLSATKDADGTVHVGGKAKAS